MRIRGRQRETTSVISSTGGIKANETDFGAENSSSSPCTLYKMYNVIAYAIDIRFTKFNCVAQQDQVFG